MNERILLIEDDVDQRRLLHEALRQQDMVVLSVSTIRDGELMFARDPFDLVLLDVMLPDGSGFDLCERIRSRSNTPVILVTARGRTEDIVEGLERGADDYITKPFHVEEVLARVRAQLRRAQRDDPAALPDRIILGSLVVDSDIRDVLVDDVRCELTPKEFDIFRSLARRAGRAVHRDAIFDEVWGLGEDRSDKILAVYVRRLRQKLERDPAHPELILTVRSHGYRVVTSPSH